MACSCSMKHTAPEYTATTGNGLACELNLQDQIEIRIYTFGKALGVHGACVASSEVVRNALINFARPFIYTTALPPHSIISIELAFDYLKENSEARKKLNENINFFRSINNSSKYRVLESSTSIQGIVVPGVQNVKRIAESLQINGLDIRPIISPTVKEGSERLRVCLHSFNTENEISKLSELLNKL
jgi:8-amino-7-oxononanoate synthase